MNTAANIPAGYRQDAQGRLVPENMITPIDLTRDELVIDRTGIATSATPDNERNYGEEDGGKRSRNILAVGPRI